MFKRLIQRIDTNSLGIMLIFGGGNVFLCWLSKQIAVLFWHWGRDHTLLGMLGLLFFSAPAIFYESVFVKSNIGAWLSVSAVIIGLFIASDLRPRFKWRAANLAAKVSGEQVRLVIIAVIVIPILLLVWAFQMTVTLLMSLFIRLSIIVCVVWPLSIIFDGCHLTIEPRYVHIITLVINVIIWTIAILGSVGGEEGS